MYGLQMNPACEQSEWGGESQNMSTPNVFYHALGLSPFYRCNPDPASLVLAAGVGAAGVCQPQQPVGGLGEEAL